MSREDSPSLRQHGGMQPGSSGQPLADIDLGHASTRSLVEAAPDGIVLADDDGRILLVNRQTEVLFGYDRDELLGRSVDDLLPQRFRTMHRAYRSRYRGEPRTRPMGSGLTLWGRRKDGSEFPVEISLSPMVAQTQPMVVAVIRDVTERMATEAEAKRILELLDATRDGLFIFDSATLRFTYVNSGAAEQSGYDRDTLLAMTFRDITPQYTDHEIRVMLAPLVSGETEALQFLTVERRRDGVDIPVEIVLQTQDTTEPGATRSFVAIVRDVRERLETEERLWQAQQELRLVEDHERIARDLHDTVIQQLFASGMTLQGASTRIKEPAVADRVAAVVDDLDRTIREIRSVIFGLQTLGTATGGRRTEILEIAAENRAILGFAPRVRFDGPAETITDDIASHLLPTLREALANVARHADASSVAVTIEVGDRVVMRVDDNGVGIPERTIATGNGNGNGLRNMVERATHLGGCCTVRARPEGGTTIEWSVPSDAR